MENKELAEFAGFYLSDVKVVYRYWSGKRQPCWLCPDGSVSYGVTGRGSIPNFLKSLDACFKWLVPKLERVEIHFYKGDPSLKLDKYWYCSLWRRDQISIYEHSEIPALALCKAIEKLIEKAE